MWQLLRSRYRDAQFLSLAFKALNFILVVPLAAAILHFCLARWGRAAVGNFEIARFLLSLEGLAAVASVGAILLASFYVEMSGLIRLIGDERLPWWRAFASSTGIFHRLIELGLRQLVVYFGLLLPFAAAAALVLRWLWHGRDINGLIILQPPEFWWGVGIAGGILAIYVAIACWLCLRWLYALPILTFEAGVSPREALRSSAERSHKSKGQAALALIVWAVGQVLLAVAVLGLMKLLTGMVLSRSYESLNWVAAICGGLLIVNTFIAVNLSIFSNLTLATLVLGLYRNVSPAETLQSTLPATPSKTTGRRWLVTMAVLCLLSFVAGYFILNFAPLPPGVEITAHRAGATHGPENTIAALRKAIADGADWAEIDVQLTADKALVIMHDTDLARVGGGNREVGAATLAEIQALDVGTSFGPDFAGERIPTLQEVLAAAKDRIRLNVELKPKKNAEELTPRVLEEIRAADMLDQCRICSQSYESLQIVRKSEPKVPIGFIVATSVGDPTALDVDFLMIKGNMATRKFVDRARLQNITIHAWTINNADDVPPLVAAGVDNIITDDAAMIRGKVDELRALNNVQWLLLQARFALVR